MIERDKFIIYSAGYFTKKEVQLYKELVRICLGILCLSLVAQDQAMWIQRRLSVKCCSFEVKREYTAGEMGEWEMSEGGRLGVLIHHWSVNCVVLLMKIKSGNLLQKILLHEIHTVCMWFEYYNYGNGFPRCKNSSQNSLLLFTWNFLLLNLWSEFSFCSCLYTIIYLHNVLNK